LENVKITPSEVEEYYNKIPKDSLRFYESQLDVSQIILYPKANKEVEDYVTARLEDMKNQVESGKQKFEALAKLYSEDPAVKDNGGQYSVNRNDKSWDPTFLAAAFKLKEGQISPVIKSKFGLHIIQMVSRAGDDAVVRHILMIPPVTDVEVNASIKQLDSIRSMIMNGTVSFAAAVTKYSEDENSKFTSGHFTAPDGSSYVTIDQLDKDAVVALKDMKVGDISKPQTYTDDRNRKVVRIIYLHSRTEPHRENLKDDYDKVAQRALEEKKQQVLEKWFKDHVADYYITVDKGYGGCANVIGDWINASNNNTSASK
jgi:peptidyl-prolyl cis-trans isomerase SurA